MTKVCVLLMHRKLNKTPTTAKQLHIVNILIFCMLTEHKCRKNGLKQSITTTRPTSHNWNSKN